ncbi:MAG: YggU family protein [Nitrospirae bacterium]|nr:YggU family protein [Nitrospirota bacterium]
MLDGIPFRKGKHGMVLKVRVEPRSSRAEVVGVLGDALKVKLTSAPVDGAANRQLVEVLSRFFGIRKSAVRILKGETSKNKIVELEGIEEDTPRQ